MRECSATTGFGGASLQHNDGLAAVACLSEGCDEAIGVADGLGIEGDDARAVILDQRAHEVGNAERCFVAATDGDAKAEAEVLRAGMRVHRDAAALADD